MQDRPSEAWEDSRSRRGRATGHRADGGYAGCPGPKASSIRRIKPMVDQALAQLSPTFDRMYACPASTIFAGWRQSVLPVHLLGLAPLLGSVGPVAGDVKLQDDGVVHDPVNRRGGGHGVGKDALPLREDQV